MREAERIEMNFDGLVGPTHHYGGLSAGNIASGQHRWEMSHPRQAALQGLAKMRYLAERGIPQAVLPPPPRPVFAVLRAAGFTGSEEEVVRDAWKEAPGLLSACYSASAMWTANAATVTPGCDSGDGRTHITPANLTSMFHRSIEPPATGRVLRQIFGDERFFAHHDPLPPGRVFSDEGAANHTRFATESGVGVHLFVYGFEPFGPDPRLKFPARQSLEASRAIARLHGLPSERVIFAQQAPEAIEAGVFHNDVASVGNENLFLYHGKAFTDSSAVIWKLEETFRAAGGGHLVACEVPNDRVSLEEAVRTYLFNSQVLRLPGGGMLLLAPEECRQSDVVEKVIQEWIDDSENPIVEVAYVNLRESMRNGGGPACLRLRIVLSPEERKSLRGRVIWTPELDEELQAWVRRNYRQDLTPPDLADPALIEENRQAMAELGSILELELEADTSGRWQGGAK